MAAVQHEPIDGERSAWRGALRRPGAYRRGGVETDRGSRRCAHRDRQSWRCATFCAPLLCRRHTRRLRTVHRRPGVGDGTFRVASRDRLLFINGRSSSRPLETPPLTPLTKPTIARVETAKTREGRAGAWSKRSSRPEHNAEACFDWTPVPSASYPVRGGSTGTGASPLPCPNSKDAAARSAALA
jgi:hypothetical protein